MENHHRRWTSRATLGSLPVRQIRSRFGTIRVCLITLLLVPAFVGCDDDIDTVRTIQLERQMQMQAKSDLDHLGEATRLLSTLVELNAENANQQIVYHLNRWAEGQAELPAGAEAPKILKTLSTVAPVEQLSQRVTRVDFSGADIPHLRNAYLFNQLIEWVNTDICDDILLEDWFADFEAADDGAEDAEGHTVSDKLRTAARLFDWTTRNIALEPLETIFPPQMPKPKLAPGVVFEGPGYRQSDFETLMRGSGDAYQRAGIFTQLCNQAGIPAAVLATQSAADGELTPWAVGVLVGTEIYLFDPRLGIFIPGPDQSGIATLSEARRDASIMRRLTVQGFFDYPLTKDDVQQSVALLNVLPEALAARMLRLENGFTGDRRLTLFTDTKSVAEQFDAITGISGVRLWTVPIIQESYHAALEKFSERDPIFNFWYRSRWAILEAEIKSSQDLKTGRWRHVTGNFADDKEEDVSGARTLYINQRAPEFEIDDLRIDVELQKIYGIRRELGVDPQVYEQQVAQVQDLMRQGKRTASYWVSLVQYDDGRFETAGNWFGKRVLDESQPSRWFPAARYNWARTAEQIGDADKAIELYKTDGDPQEHGNRLRARLLSR